MTNTFVPHKQEKTVFVKISAREADLINKLRNYAFGKFVVHKANDILIRVEITDSQLIGVNNEEKEEKVD